MDNQFNEQDPDRSMEREREQQNLYRNEYLGADKHSGPGIASFIVSLVMAIAYIVLIVTLASVVVRDFAGVLEGVDPGSQELPPGLIEQIQNPEFASSLLFVGVGFMGAFAGSLIALVLGIIGLLQKNRKKVFAVIGTILSGLLVGIPALLFLSSMMMQ